MQHLRSATLNNGLQVLALESHTAPVATCWVWYRVGSRNEIPGFSGISHWVEHMLFKGTPTHPKGTLTRYIDRLGGRWNAFTWKDYTAYHEVLPADHLAVAIRLEADRMANTIFDPVEVESERTVIIAEREGSENYPAYLLREDVDAAAHKIHPYRIPVIGWKDDLRAITRDDLFRHYRGYYHPANAIAVVVGAFDASRVLEGIREAFESIPAGETPPPVRAVEPPQEGERRVTLHRPGGATSYLHLAYHMPQARHPDVAALLVIDGILSGFKSVVPFDQGGGGRSARLYRALVETSLASDVSSSVIPSIDPTLFRIMATARAGVDVAALEERTLQEIERLAREPVPPAELAKVKKQAKAQFVFAQDGVFRTAMAIGAFAVVDGALSFLQLLERIDRVNVEDVMKAAATYFTPLRRTIGSYTPVPGATTSTAVQAAHRPEIFHYHPRTRTQAPAGTITPESVTRTQLSNGLVMLTREQRGTGMVAVHGYLKAGAMFDGERAGLSRFTSALLQRGTQSRTSLQIAETLEGMGASVAVGSSMDAVAVGARMLREDARTTLEILADMLIRPSFPLDEVEKTRGEILTGLRITAQDTRVMAERTARRLMYPAGHPYAQMSEGDDAAVQAMTRTDLAGFHEQHMQSNAAMFALVGDISTAEAIEVLSQVFSGWLGGAPWRLPPLPQPPRRTTPQRGEVRLPGKTQSDIALGAPGLARNDPGYYEAMMANLIVGQIGMMGRLGESVRERQGMAYYAFSDLRAGILAGPWWVRAGVNPQNETRAIETILEEIRSFQRAGASDEELSDARNFLIGSLALQLETNAGIAQTLANIELFGLGLDYLVRFPDIIRTRTAEGIIEAARRFPLEGCTIAIAGPPPVV